LAITNNSLCEDKSRKQHLMNFVSYVKLNGEHMKKAADYAYQNNKMSFYKSQPKPNGYFPATRAWRNSGRD